MLLASMTWYGITNTSSTARMCYAKECFGKSTISNILW